VGLGWLERRSVRQSFTVLGHANLGLIALAIVAEGASMLALARLQRRLLRAGGVRLSIASMVVIVYASNAISVSVPIAGYPMSAAFSFRSLARRGADRILAGWVLAISGVTSTVAFALVVAVGGMVSGNAVAGVVGALAASATVVPLLGCLIAQRHRGLRTRIESIGARGVGLAQRFMQRPLGDPRQLIDATVDRLAGLRLKERGWAFVFSLAILNWLANIACLALAVMAVRSPVPWSGLILAWSVGVGAASFGITPGGVGLVEAALAGALVAEGVEVPQAVAAVLVYRLISFWLIDVAGWTLYVMTRRQGASQRRRTSCRVSVSDGGISVGARGSLERASRPPTKMRVRPFGRAIRLLPDHGARGAHSVPLESQILSHRPTDGRSEGKSA
jgi:uncharacterized protein (TIRG00374 family)